MNSAAHTSSDEAAVLYRCKVMHRRQVPPLYRFVYQLFYLLVDIDALPQLHARHRLFSHNRFNLLSLYDRDHAAAPGGLRAWVDQALGSAGIDLAGGRVRLLCLPRVFGWVFNPISLFYCEHADGGLRAVIAEVRNTFGERHCYLLASAGAPITYQQSHEKEKSFHVSPFFDLVGRYRFQFDEPGERLRVLIQQTRESQPTIDTRLIGARLAFTDGNLLRQTLAMPWITLKVVLAIHWEALKIWLRGGRFHSKPSPPDKEIS